MKEVIEKDSENLKENINFYIEIQRFVRYKTREMMLYTIRKIRVFSHVE